MMETTRSFYPTVRNNESFGLIMKQFSAGRASVCFGKFHSCAVICQQHGLAVPRADNRSYVTGSIRGCSQSHLPCMSGGC